MIKAVKLTDSDIGGAEWEDEHLSDMDGCYSDCGHM